MSDVSIGQNRTELRQIAATYQEAPIQPVADAKEQIQKRIAAIREHLGSAVAELALLRDDVTESATEAAEITNVTEVVRAGLAHLLQGTVDHNRLNVLMQADITASKADAGAHDIAALDGDIEKIIGAVAVIDNDLATLEPSIEPTFSTTTSLPENFGNVNDAIDQT